MGHVNETALAWTTIDDGHMHVRRKQLGEAAGGEQLGASLYAVPPGEVLWAYHYHTANEEALYVLDGEGTLRLDGDRRPIEPGDYVALPAEETGAHQVINDGDAPLRCLIVSTMHEPDVTVYPDSKKFGVYVGSPPGGREERTLSGYYRMADDVDYWTGQEPEG